MVINMVMRLTIPSGTSSTEIGAMAAVDLD
jgi:hypothetical protein